MQYQLIEWEVMEIGQAYSSKDGVKQASQLSGSISTQQYSYCTSHLLLLVRGWRLGSMAERSC